MLGNNSQWRRKSAELLHPRHTCTLPAASLGPAARHLDPENKDVQ